MLTSKASDGLRGCSSACCRFFVSLLLPPFPPTLLAHSTMARQQTAVVLCLAAAVILQLLVPAQAHMVMIEPKSRQWLDYTLRYNYNPHAVNGGGAQLAGSLIGLPARSAVTAAAAGITSAVLAGCQLTAALVDGSMRPVHPRSAAAAALLYQPAASQPCSRPPCLLYTQVWTL